MLFSLATYPFNVLEQTVDYDYQSEFRVSRSIENTSDGVFGLSPTFDDSEL